MRLPLLSLMVMEYLVQLFKNVIKNPIRTKDFFKIWILGTRAVFGTPRGGKWGCPRSITLRGPLPCLLSQRQVLWLRGCFGAVKGPLGAAHRDFIGPIRSGGLHHAAPLPFRGFDTKF